jgi:hypothetical protein
MLPILTPEEMRIVDAWAPDPVEVLDRTGGRRGRRARDAHARRNVRADRERDRGDRQQRRGRACAARLLEARGVKVACSTPNAARARCLLRTS